MDQIVNRGAGGPRSLFGRWFAAGRGNFIAVGLFSSLVNVLALTGSLYMLQVYDRVLPSHSTPTLVGLTLIMLVLYAGYGVLDRVRLRMLSRLSLRLERSLRRRVFERVMALPLKSSSNTIAAQQALNDVDEIRKFLSGKGPVALFDLPWLFFYIGLVALLHPLLGLLAAAGSSILVLLTLLTDVKSRTLIREAAAMSAARSRLSEASLRNAEAVCALGMRDRLTSLWDESSEKLINSQILANDISVGYGASAKVLRLVLQSAVLGLGAWLVLKGEATAGVMIAASILVARAIAPVEAAIANWRGFIAARQSHERLRRLFDAMPERTPPLSLPSPRQLLEVETLTVMAPGQAQPVVHNVTLSLRAGGGLGIVGPVASGKSTLARAIVGVWPASRGVVRLDGASIDRWTPDVLGHSIGYLPQDIELFDGTIASNIARLAPDPPSGAVLQAAKDAGVHEMILRLPDGYETRIGEGGRLLSAGQRQRIALARALYGTPFLVVLDEPNSNLDAEGDVALTRAIAAVRARGGIVIVIAHRISALSSIDNVVVMADGRIQSAGSTDDMLRKIRAQAAAQPNTSLLSRPTIVAKAGQGAAS
ncbi:MAG: type I secretion system permease/ATPase [Hyphomicrobium sp.]